jgi:putative oxidoreductase
MLGHLGGTAALFLRCASVGVAILLLIGLATPIAGIVDAAIEVGIIVWGKHYDSSFMLVASIGVALAMLGPGAWSLDAWVFGRKRIV